MADTVTAPVVGFSAMPVGHVPNWATVAFGDAPLSIAGKPFTVSFAATLATGVDGVPEVAVPLSNVATILAVTVIVSIALPQLMGVFLSHS